MSDHFTEHCTGLFTITKGAQHTIQTLLSIRPHRSGNLGNQNRSRCGQRSTSNLAFAFRVVAGEIQTWKSRFFQVVVHACAVSKRDIGKVGYFAHVDSHNSCAQIHSRQASTTTLLRSRCQAGVGKEINTLEVVHFHCRHGCNVVDHPRFAIVTHVQPDQACAGQLGVEWLTHNGAKHR